MHANEIRQFYADARHEHKKYDFFQLMGCRVGYHDYDTRTKITGELQLLLDYGKIIRLVTFLNRNQLSSRVLQLQVNFSSKFGSIS